MSSLCGVEIAGLGIEVRIDNSKLAHELMQRYRFFPLHSAPRVTLDLHYVAGERTSALPDFAFWDGQLLFTAPGYTGYIDIVRGRGELTFSSAHPVADADHFLRCAFALLAFASGGLLLHAAGVVHNGHAYLFLGHSGSGKSTVARLSPSSQVLNDDLILLWPAEGCWWAYATPFGNPTSPMSRPDHAPLRVLLGLVQDQDVRLEKVKLAVAMAEMVGNAPVVSIVPGWTEVLLERCHLILQAAPYQRLHFRPDDSFWKVLHGESDTAHGTPADSGDRND